MRQISATLFCKIFLGPFYLIHCVSASAARLELTHYSSTHLSPIPVLTQGRSEMGGLLILRTVYV